MIIMSLEGKLRYFFSVFANDDPPKEKWPPEDPRQFRYYLPNKRLPSVCSNFLAPQYLYNKLTFLKNQ